MRNIQFLLTPSASLAPISMQAFQKCFLQEPSTIAYTNYSIFIIYKHFSQRYWKSLYTQTLPNTCAFYQFM